MREQRSGASPNLLDRVVAAPRPAKKGEEGAKWMLTSSLSAEKAEGERTVPGMVMG